MLLVFEMKMCMKWFLKNYLIYYVHTSAIHKHNKLLEDSILIPRPQNKDLHK
jgi:hypothetical protein